MRPDHSCAAARAPPHPACCRSPDRHRDRIRMSSLVGPRSRSITDLGRWTRSRHRNLDIGLVSLILITTIIAFLAPVLAPYNPVQPVGDLDLGPFSPHHLLGTDSIGRDLLSRALNGMRTSWLS